jgi:hypothetical protein
MKFSNAYKREFHHGHNSTHSGGYTAPISTVDRSSHNDLHNTFESLHLRQKQINEILAFLKTSHRPVNTDPSWLAAPEASN